MTCDVILEKKECIRYWVVETIIYYFKFRHPTLNDLFMKKVGGSFPPVEKSNEQCIKIQ